MTDPDGANVRFRQIFDDNFEAVRAYCLRRLPADDAHDATSDVFLVAWRRIGDVPVGDDARLWLFGVARNTVRTVERRTRRVLRLRARPDGLADTATPGPEIQVVTGVEYQKIMASFDRLRSTDQAGAAPQALGGAECSTGRCGARLQREGRLETIPTSPRPSRRGSAGCGSSKDPSPPGFERR